MLLVDSVLDSLSSLAGMMLSEVASEVWRSRTPVCTTSKPEVGRPSRL